jgi:hypothetical protein
MQIKIFIHEGYIPKLLQKWGIRLSGALVSNARFTGVPKQR